MTQSLRTNYFQYRHVAIVLTLILAWGIRVYDLDSRSLWFDEGMEYWVATSSIHDMPQNVMEGIQDPPLYSILLHFWMKLGHSEFHLRFLSVVFSFLSIIGTIRLGYKNAGFSTGLIAGAIMAILPSQIRYSQEVGQYALMVCLLVWSLVILQEISGGKWSKYFLWGTLAIAVTYIYYGGVFTALIPACIILVQDLKNRHWQNFRRLFAVLLLYVIGITPLIIYFLPVQLFRGPTTDAFKFALSSPVGELKDFWISTLQLIAFQFTGWPWTNIPFWLPAYLVMALLVLSAFAKGSKKQLLLWLLMIWIVYYAIGKLGLFPYGYRYSLVLTPLLIPVISQGLVATFTMGKHLLGIGILLLLIAMSIISLPNRTVRDNLHSGTNWEWPETEDLGPIAKYWLENRKETEPTYVYYGAVPVFPYYLSLFGQNNNLPPTWYTHCWREESPNYCQVNNIYYGKWIRHLDQDKKMSSIKNQLPSNSNKVWLIFSHIHAEEDDIILTGFLKNYDIALNYEENNASVYLLEIK